MGLFGGGGWKPKSWDVARPGVGWSSGDESGTLAGADGKTIQADILTDDQKAKIATLTTKLESGTVAPQAEQTVLDTERSADAQAGIEALRTAAAQGDATITPELEAILQETVVAPAELKFKQALTDNNRRFGKAGSFFGSENVQAGKTAATSFAIGIGQARAQVISNERERVLAERLNAAGQLAVGIGGQDLQAQIAQAQMNTQVNLANLQSEQQTEASRIQTLAALLTAPQFENIYVEGKSAATYATAGVL